MRTTLDHRYRIVAVANLRAMCERMSGVCHRYWVEKVSRSRVWVAYSNPNEYAVENPMYAVFPCYPNAFEGEGDRENPLVVLDFLRVINDSWNGEGHQAFVPVTDCVRLWRDVTTQRWESRAEIEAVSPERSQG